VMKDDEVPSAPAGPGRGSEVDNGGGGGRRGSP